MASLQEKNPWSPRAQRRHRRAWRILFFLLGGLLRRIFRLRLEQLPPADGGRLIFCNHPSMLDPLFLGLASPEQFYFVASEALLQRGLRSWLLHRYLCPVIRQKGTVAATTAFQMLRLLRQGHSVCLFPEGIATANGVLCPPLTTAAKLVRASHVSLVTYRLEGAYLAGPKWAAYRRRGPIFGVVAGTYQSQQLVDMSVSQVMELICRDLGYNDYSWQEKRHIAYPCPRGPAVGLENVLYLCPKCGKIGTLTADGRQLKCSCGMHATMDDYGFFTGDYHTVYDWDMWQTGELVRRLQAGECTCLTAQGATLYRVDGHHAYELFTGCMSMDIQTLRLGTYSFELKQLTGMSIHGRNYLVFFCNGTHYEIKTLKTHSAYSAYPFLTMYRIFGTASGQ